MLRVCPPPPKRNANPPPRSDCPGVDVPQLRVPKALDFFLPSNCCGFHDLRGKVWKGPKLCDIQTVTLARLSSEPVLTSVFYFICLLGLQVQYMEASRLGAKEELQLPAYTTVKPDLSLIGDHHRSQQHGILNPLRPGVEPTSSWILVGQLLLNHRRTPILTSKTGILKPIPTTGEKGKYLVAVCDQTAFCVFKVFRGEKGKGERRELPLSPIEKPVGFLLVLPGKKTL